ncbi:MAG: 3-dehydroquinate synthase [Bifidobacteriaceae bacterium]|jgi:shikimate kinase/3-dehydroquinate synthase|nr:3-dehydroquinate synthase [Bifidobacteriaceae bacterium]
MQIKPSNLSKKIRTLPNFNNPKIIFIGMPGTGKSHIGMELCSILNNMSYGYKFIDTDQLVMEKASMSISDYFEKFGELEFRNLEAKVIKKALSSTANNIISTGGGAVLNQEVYNAIMRQRENGAIIVYTKSYGFNGDDIIFNNSNRPLLKTPSDWNELFKKRAVIYEKLASVSIFSSIDGVRVESKDNSAIISNAFKFYRQNVCSTPPELGPDKSNKPDSNVCGTIYDVIMSMSYDDLIHELTADIPYNSEKIMILHTSNTVAYAERIRESVAHFKLNKQVYLREVPDGEDGKKLTEFAGVLEDLAGSGFTRNDLIIGVGGGALTDMSGYCAAAYLRGIRYFNVPTSLLAIVDASTGGKTAVNLEAGKNLVGAFYNPLKVYCGLESLYTLSIRDFKEAFGEIIKAGCIRDKSILPMIDEFFESVNFGGESGSDSDPVGDSIDLKSLIKLTFKSVGVKIQVVSKDFTEQGERELLNFGHTFAHAIEKHSAYEVRHGEAVGVGMVFAAHLGVELGTTSPKVLDQILKSLKVVGLPSTLSELEKYSPGISSYTLDEFLSVMQIDKKARGADLRFVVLRDFDEWEIATNPSADVLKAAFEATAGV